MYIEKRNKKDDQSGENKNKEIILKHTDNNNYGEQIPSLFSWITPEEQKRRAKELENITDRKFESNNNNRPS